MTGPEPVDLAGSVGLPAERLLERLPARPVADRTGRGDRWLVFELPAVSLRVRCERREGSDRVASWTASFEDPPASLRAAAERLGLWPELAPDAGGAEAGSMIRRPLRSADGEAVHSVTAAVRDGRVVQVTAFDEPPDWREG